MSRHRVDLQTPDGVLDCYVFEPAGVGPWPAVVLYMDAFGIRDDLDVMAARLAGAGYVVAVPNLYHRSGVFAPFDPALVAAGGTERDRFMGMIKSINGDLVMQDTAAVLAHLDTAIGSPPPHRHPGLLHGRRLRAARRRHLSRSRRRGRLVPWRVARHRPAR